MNIDEAIRIVKAAIGSKWNSAERVEFEDRIGLYTVRALLLFVRESDKDRVDGYDRSAQTRNARDAIDEAMKGGV